MPRTRTLSHCLCCGHEWMTGCAIRTVCRECEKQGHTGWKCQLCKKINEEEIIRLKRKYEPSQLNLSQLPQKQD